MILFGKQNAPPGQDLFLEAGPCTFPFSIILPPNLPTSFEHMYGIIRYSIKGNIDIPWALDKHTERSFTVISHYDLNANPALRQPYGASETKILCCGPCKSDPIIATFQVMKQGFVPGETLVFSATIDNKSNKEIKELKVTLRQNIRFHATSKTKSTYRDVSVLRYPNKISQRSIEHWNNVTVQIPPIVSSSNGTCRIINVSYSIILNFDASGVAISKDVPIPITIGTIPLYDSNPNTNQILMNQNNNNNFNISPANNNYNGVPPPPTYQECMFDRDASSSLKPDENELKGEIIQSDANIFKPIYPYYPNMSANY